MNILIVAATTFEISPLLDHMEETWEKPSFFEYKKGDVSIFPLITGVGATMTAFAMARYLGMPDIDLAINAGICGTLSPYLELTEVVEIFEDRFADIGIEEKDGSFTDIFELELHDPNVFPYTNGWISNVTATYDAQLPRVRGITVNKVHGEQNSITQIKAKYAADVESMEGAAFLMAIKNFDVDGLQIRAISNHVEPRNRANWKVDGAIEKLNDYLINLIGRVGAKGPK